MARRPRDKSELKKQRAVYATDKQWNDITELAEQAAKDNSNFVVETALASKHVPA